MKFSHPIRHMERKVLDVRQQTMKEMESDHQTYDRSDQTDDDDDERLLMESIKATSLPQWIINNRTHCCWGERVTLPEWESDEHRSKHGWKVNL